ncbi:MAG: bifunctional 4-hydroxy-2-oxoglutarate aldolase/2-dehydro-3-deoxy-phosphogluconate aldolase [Rubellimicrobium sp.]|nr:bifunctional 4-hydroxy-2-oxoglutarate aldolase/2-dehydro-3-deoxy-phosphogluconate aldolase [Rubellimicrobium sp.]
MTLDPHDASTRIARICALAPVVPVLVVEDADQADPLARALVAGGLPALEVTLRTPAALEAIRLMAGVAGAVVGAGTLLGPADVEAACAAGASFGVSPGVTDRLVDAALANGLPILCGTATPSEAMRLLERGITVAKFFPAEANGGPAVLRAWAGPLPQMRFCPTGGIGAGTATAWLALPNVMCVGGSWVAPADALAASDWDRISALARAALALRPG